MLRSKPKEMSKLENSEASHEQKKIHKCEIWNKTCRDSYTLRRHEKTHSQFMNLKNL